MILVAFTRRATSLGPWEKKTDDSAEHRQYGDTRVHLDRLNGDDCTIRTKIYNKIISNFEPGEVQRSCRRASFRLHGLPQPALLPHLSACKRASPRTHVHRSFSVRLHLRRTFEQISGRYARSFIKPWHRFRWKGKSFSWYSRPASRGKTSLPIWTAASFWRIPARPDICQMMRVHRNRKNIWGERPAHLSECGGRREMGECRGVGNRRLRFPCLPHLPS